MTYAVPPGGLPPQTRLTTDRARFTEAYAVIPRLALLARTGCRVWVGPPLRVADLVASIRDHDLCLIRHRRSSR